MASKEIPVNRPAAQRRSSRFAAVWVFGWSAITLLCDVTAGWSIVRQQMALDFPTIQGTIISSKIELQHDEDGTAYRPEISYGYVVAGRRFTCDRYSYCTWMPSRLAKAGEIVGRHPPGSRVVVYYNPTDPADAVLRPGLVAADFLIPLFLTPFNLIMVGSWVFAARWRSRANAAKQKRDADGEVTLHATTVDLMENRSKAFRSFRVVDRGTDVRLRPALAGPLPAAALTTTLSAFVATLVIALVTDSDPSATEIALAWALVAASAGIAACFAATGPFDTVIDRVRGTLRLPFGLGRLRPLTIERANVVSVEVTDVAGPRSDEPMFATTILYRRDGQIVREQLSASTNWRRGDELVNWLRNELGLKT